jgi:hypothetical protein
MNTHIIEMKLSNNNGISTQDINYFLRDIINYGGCFSKDLLPKKLKNNYWYVVNMQDSYAGNGTHWICFKYNTNVLTYFDSFGIKPPNEIMKYATKDILYSKKQIQDYNSTSCGWFCIACIIYDSRYKLKSIEHFNNYINSFSNDTNKNDNILYNHLKKLGIQ